MPDRDAARRDLRRIVRRYGADPDAEVPLLSLHESNYVGVLEARVTDLFGGESDLAKRWLAGINALLNNRRPIDVLRHGHVQDVVDALDAMEAGTYA